MKCDEEERKVDAWWIDDVKEVIGRRKLQSGLS